MFKHLATDTGKGNWTVIAWVATTALFMKWSNYNSAVLQSPGMVHWCREALNKVDKQGANSFDNSLSSLDGNPSGPIALNGSILLSS